MLRPSFARKVIRLRAARQLVRAYQTPLPEDGYSPSTSPQEASLPHTKSELYEPARPLHHDVQERRQQYMGFMEARHGSPPVSNQFPVIPLYPGLGGAQQAGPSELDGFHQLDQDASLESPEASSSHDVIKARLSERADLENPEMDDDSLRAFYSALVSSGAEDIKKSGEKALQKGAPSRKILSKEARTRLLERLTARLADSEIASIPDGQTVEGQSHDLVVAKPDVQLARTAVNLLSKVTLPGSSKSVFSLKGKEKDVRPTDLPSGLASQLEWDALFDTFIARHDARGAEELLDTMMQHGMRPSEEQVLMIMKRYAKDGEIDNIARITTNLLSAGVAITESHHQAFITALIAPDPPNISTAIQYLRELEKAGTPLPQASYNLVLSRLTTPTPTHQTNSHSRADAWDLFYNMRLHAHPAPNRSVYATMIRACSDPRDPQPERARDLWTEMTQEGDRVTPQREEYDAIIRALGSTKKDYLEAFELLRQMLAKHHEATVEPFDDEPKKLWSPYVPTLSTFTSLMEGTKRAGDLERARWILSELVGLVRSSFVLGGRVMDGPDEELMSGLFMTYAAWKPKSQRSGIKHKRAEEDKAEKGEEEPELPLEAANLEELASTESLPAESSTSRPSSLAPVTAADAIREADGLFARILSDASAKEANIFAHPFCEVNLNTRLVNSYLSVHLSHFFEAGRSDTRQLWESTWKAVSAVQPGVNPNGWSYMMLLEFGGRKRRPGESPESRGARNAWGKEAWAEYRAWFESIAVKAETGDMAIVSVEESQRSPPPSPVEQRLKWIKGIGERQVERCWRAAIRLYTMSDELDTALNLIREFHRQYPPSDITRTYNPLAPPSRDGVRITDPTSIAEPDVPPHLIFEDVGLLHQKLIMKHRVKELKEVDYIVNSYLGRLRQRKVWRMQGRLRPEDVTALKKSRKRVGAVRMIEGGPQLGEGTLESMSEEESEAARAQEAIEREEALERALTGGGGGEEEEGDWDAIEAEAGMPDRASRLSGPPTTREHSGGLGPIRQVDRSVRHSPRPRLGGESNTPERERVWEPLEPMEAYVNGDWDRPRSFQSYMVERRHNLTTRKKTAAGSTWSGSAEAEYRREVNGE